MSMASVDDDLAKEFSFSVVVVFLLLASACSTPHNYANAGFFSSTAVDVLMGLLIHRDKFQHTLGIIRESTRELSRI